MKNIGNMNSIDKDAIKLANNLYGEEITTKVLHQHMNFVIGKLKNSLYSHVYGFLTKTLEETQSQVLTTLLLKESMVATSSEYCFNHIMTEIINGNIVFGEVDNEDCGN